MWLNGKPLGSHRGYYEPFRFDVTGLLKEKNTLAVRVIAGPKFGEPRAYWALFPVVPAQEQRYVRDKAQSIRGFTNGDLAHRRRIRDPPRGVFGNRGRGVRDGGFRPRQAGGTKRPRSPSRPMRPWPGTRPSTWKSCRRISRGGPIGRSVSCDVPQGPGKQTVVVPMPEVSSGRPRRHASIAAALASRRSAVGGRQRCALRLPIVHDRLQAASAHRAAGRYVLANGTPLVSAGHEHPGTERPLVLERARSAVDIDPDVKAGNFNAVRSDQHVCYPEVRELLDRLGMMSEQDQGSGGMVSRFTPEQWRNCPAPARPWPGRATTTRAWCSCRSAMRPIFDPAKDDRGRAGRRSRADHLKPISGTDGCPRPIPNCPYWANVVHDFHDYSGWYADMAAIGNLSKVRASRPTSHRGRIRGRGAGRLRNHAELSGPLAENAAGRCRHALRQVQVQKTDARQIIGFRGQRPWGASSNEWYRRPTNLGQYIEASQNYQADLLGRISPRDCGCRRGRSAAIFSSTSSTSCRPTGPSRLSATTCGRRKPITRWPR